MIPPKGWAEMIKKVYEINPHQCPKCHGQMRIITFFTYYYVVDRNINDLKLSLKAERPRPQASQQQPSIAAEERSEYFG